MAGIKVRGASDPAFLGRRIRFAVSGSPADRDGRGHMRGCQSPSAELASDACGC